LRKDLALWIPFQLQTEAMNLWKADKKAPERLAREPYDAIITGMLGRGYQRYGKDGFCDFAGGDSGIPSFREASAGGGIMGAIRIPKGVHYNTSIQPESPS